MWERCTLLRCTSSQHASHSVPHTSQRAVAASVSQFSHSSTGFGSGSAGGGGGGSGGTGGAPWIVASNPRSAAEAAASDASGVGAARGRRVVMSHRGQRTAISGSVEPSVRARSNAATRERHSAHARWPHIRSVGACRTPPQIAHHSVDADIQTSNVQQGLRDSRIFFEGCCKNRRWRTKKTWPRRTNA